MKARHTKLKNWAVIMALFAIGTPTFSSCTKDKDATEISQSTNKLTINISGISVDPTFKSSNQELSYDIKQAGDVDLAVAVGEYNPNEIAKFKADGENTTAMDQDVKLRVYILKKSDNSFVTSTPITVGEPGLIEDLDGNTDYKWVAVSYNQKDDVFPETPGLLEIPENTDLLYAEGEFNLSNTSAIHIVFNHAMARVGVELNTIGVFGEISNSPEVSITGGTLRKGTLDIASGDITATDTYNPTITFEELKQVDNGKNDALEAYFYTIPATQNEQETQPIKVTVKNVQITHYEGTNNTRTYLANGAEYDVDLIAEKGKSKKVMLNLVESAIGTEAGSQRTAWARTNLYYTGEEGARAYAFNYNNQLNSKGNSYFAFHTLVPLTLPKSNADIGDPCSLVYPKNLWKTPAKEDFAPYVNGNIDISPLVDEVVGTVSEILTNTLSNLVGLGYAPNSKTYGLLGTLYPYSVEKIEYYQSIIKSGIPATGQSNAFGPRDNDNNKLTFFYNGQIINTTVLHDLSLLGTDGLVSLRTSDLDGYDNTLINLDVPLLDTYGEFAAYWSSTDGTNLKITDDVTLLGAGSWGYSSNQNRFLGGLGGLLGGELLRAGGTTANTSAELLDLELLNLDLVESSFKNVRCVRTTAPTFSN